MLLTAQKSRYVAYGLQIQSDLALPELLPGEPDTNPDVEISYGDLEAEWEASEPQASFFRATAKGLMFAVPRMAIYQIRGGRSIVIHPLEDADEKWIRLYLLGSCIGALLLQRNVLPLHGSAVVIDGSAYCFVGESGAGKSTLAATLVGRGHSLLGDDVIPIAFDTDGAEGRGVYVTPSYPQQKLWQESLDQLGIANSGYEPLLPDTAKYAIPAAEAYCREPVPLKGIFELAPGEEAESVELSKIGKLECLPLIGRHTYRNFLISLLGMDDWHFHTSAWLAGRTDAYRIRRPLTPFSASELADRIESAVRSRTWDA